MYKTVRIRQHERGLLYRHGDFRRLLPPGKHRLWRLPGQRVEVVDTLPTHFAHPLLDVLATHPDMAAALHVLDLADDQRALVWKNGRLTYLCGPGRHAFWRLPAQIRIELFSTDTLRCAHKRLETMLTLPGADRFLQAVSVQPHERTLLFVDGRLIEALAPGRYAFWKHAGQITTRTVDLREQIADVAGQEIITADKVSLRVNLVVTWQVSDPVLAATVVTDVGQALYREAQLALRATIGARTLDALLADKETVGGEIQHLLQPRAAEFGVTVRSAGVKDLILPGEMKTILNQVIEAEKQAQANVIKRREETAAARSQANTARLLAENPGLARLRELDALQTILTGAKTTFVFGSGDLATQVRGLLQEDAGRNS